MDYICVFIWVLEIYSLGKLSHEEMDWLSYLVKWSWFFQVFESWFFIMIEFIVLRYLSVKGLFSDWNGFPMIK